MIINSEAYQDEENKYRSTIDPREHDYQSWSRMIERHMWEWTVELYNKQDRRNILIQHATFHDLVSPPVDSDPRHIKLGHSIKVRDTDLTSFCKQYHLDESAIREVSEGKLYEHRGFKRGTHIGIAFHGHLFRPIAVLDPGEQVYRKREAEKEQRRIEQAQYSVPIPGEVYEFDPANPPKLPTEKQSSNNVLISLKGLFS